MNNLLDEMADAIESHGIALRTIGRAETSEQAERAIRFLRGDKGRLAFIKDQLKNASEKDILDCIWQGAEKARQIQAETTDKTHQRDIMLGVILMTYILTDDGLEGFGRDFGNDVLRKLLI
jgi:hypothetical protein